MGEDGAGPRRQRPPEILRVPLAHEEVAPQHGQRPVVVELLAAQEPEQERLVRRAAEGGVVWEGRGGAKNETEREELQSCRHLMIDGDTFKGLLKIA